MGERYGAIARGEIWTNTPHRTPLTAWAPSQTGAYLATGSGPGDEVETGELALWEMATGRVVNVLRRIEGGVGGSYAGSVAFSADDRRVAFTFNRSAVALVDPFAELPERRAIPELSPDMSSTVSHPFCVSRDGERLFVSAYGQGSRNVPGAVARPGPGWTLGEVFAATDALARLDLLLDVGFAGSMVVGVTRGRVLAALDTETRTLRWHREHFDGVVGPFGELVERRGEALIRLDAETGDVVATAEDAPGRLGFSHDGAHVFSLTATRKATRVTIYRSDSLARLGTLEAGPLRDPAASVRADLRPIAFSRHRVALLTRAQGVLVHALEPRLPRLLTVRVGPVEPDTGLFLGAAGELALATREELRFFGPGGAAGLHHALLAFPPDDSAVRTYAAREELHDFPDGETRWGYVNEHVIVAAEDPAPRIQWVEGRRHARPIPEGVARFTTLEEAIARRRDAFPAELVEGVAYEAAQREAKAKARDERDEARRAPPPTARSPAALEQLVLGDVSATRAAPRREEIAIGLAWLLGGREEEGRALLRALGAAPDSDAPDSGARRRDDGALAHAAAYLARAGFADDARALLAGLRGLPAPIASPDLHGAELAAFRGAAEALLGGPQHLLDEALALQLDPGFAGPHLCLAKAAMLAGRHDEALARVAKLKTPAGGDDAVELLLLACDTGEPSIVRAASAALYARRPSLDYDHQAWLLDRFPGPPEDAFAWIAELKGLSPLPALERALRAVAAHADPPRLVAFVEHVCADRARPIGQRIAATAALVDVLPERRVAERLGELERELIVPPRRDGDVDVARLVRAYAAAGAHGKADALARRAGTKGVHQLAYLELLADGDPDLEAALGRCLDTDVGLRRSAITHVVRARPARKKGIVEAALKNAGRDRAALEGLAAAVAAGGDYALAVEVARRIPADIRGPAIARVAEVAIAAGDYDDALPLVEEAGSALQLGALLFRHVYRAPRRIVDA